MTQFCAPLKTILFYRAYETRLRDTLGCKYRSANTKMMYLLTYLHSFYYSWMSRKHLYCKRRQSTEQNFALVSVHASGQMT